MRTSVVLIRSTLMPSAASDWNRRLATPVWLFMPTPKTESLATRGQLRRRRAAERLGLLGGHLRALVQFGLRNGEGDVGAPLRGRRSARSCRR